jgi:[acyl-carrier-protein] S-malonyltransferase
VTATRAAVAFPGQGVDPVDTGRILYEHRRAPLVRALARHLRTDDWQGLDLTDTRVAQPAVYTASLLNARREIQRAECLEVAAVTGHSLGELAACAFAGVYSDEAGLQLAIRRAELGHSMQARRLGAMVVVMRLDTEAVEAVRSAATRAAEVLVLAVENGPRQFVLSGDHGAAARTLPLVEDRDGVARLLPIGGAFHSPLMDEVAPEFEAAAAAVIERDPVVPIVSSTALRVVSSGNELATVLGRSLLLPVRWPSTLDVLAAAGITEAIDTGPGATLANLARFTPTIPFRASRER